MRFLPFVLLLLACIALAQTDDQPVVFHSDVSLARVDAQVVDSHNRTITGLRVEDFVLREDGKPQAIRNFASENMPIDILFLLDVSASMRPHVERISNAARDALGVLAGNDRVGIMVFDTYTRLRLSFRSNRTEINRGFSDVLSVERFNGGTHITRALLSAADYVKREARPEARRAIVILTDDGSQDARDDQSVERALSRADAVLSFLQAPDVMEPQHGGMGRGGGRPGGSGGTWPGGGWPGIGLPGSGPVILGGGGGRGGRYPGGGIGNHTAGTADIARESGGDTFPVDDASALEQTLTRLRQRYALHYNSTVSSASNARHTVQVDLTDAARRRYPDAEIRYRQVFLSGNSREAGAISITRAHSPEGGSVRTADATPPANSPPTGIDDMITPRRRRLAVDQTYGSSPNITPKDENADSGSADPPK